jgi:hypothetical protein
MTPGNRECPRIKIKDFSHDGFSRGRLFSIWHVGQNGDFPSLACKRLREENVTMRKSNENIEIWLEPTFFGLSLGEQQSIVWSIQEQLQWLMNYLNGMNIDFHASERFLCSDIIPRFTWTRRGQFPRLGIHLCCVHNGRTNHSNDETKNDDEAVQRDLRRLAKIIVAMYFIEHPLPDGTGTLPFLYPDPSGDEPGK